MNIHRLFRSFTIRVRMAGAVAMVLGLFALVGATALVGGARLKSLNEDFMSQSVGAAHLVADIRADMAQVRIHEKNMVIDYEDAARVAQHQVVWLQTVTKVRGHLERLQARALQGGPTAQAAQQALADLAEYQKSTEHVVTQIKEGAYDGARATDRMLNRAKTLVDKVAEQVVAIDADVTADGERMQADFSAAMRTTMIVFIGVLLLVVVVVAPLTLVNSRTITAPMQHARDAAHAIAGGDLTQPIVIEGRDEAAELLTALLAMQQSLQRIVGDIRVGTSAINTSSGEIAAGNQDLSGRTEQTASSLQQTSSSMEQLTGTVRQTADSARTANQLASSAAQAAQRGGEVVSQVVANMEEISTSSRKIADIIGVIDGIAFQTNILALNAAVEAARAGEQGRGFAVVATEVRNLAQRSANAAREIKTLIGASVEKVESGSRLVQDAGSTMTEIVSGVQRVTDIIGEITAAATEQSNELVQVNTAVTQLDQMTQQNAALVEQSAAAAESLNHQAGRLADLVSNFRCADDGTATPSQRVTV